MAIETNLAPWHTVKLTWSDGSVETRQIRAATPADACAYFLGKGEETNAPDDPVETWRRVVKAQSGLSWTSVIA